MIKGILKPKKVEQPSNDLAASMMGTVQLFNELKVTKETVEKTLSSKVSEVESIIEEARNTVSDGAKKIDDKISEFNNTAVSLIKEIKGIPTVKGDPGKDADEQTIQERILASIPSKEEVINEALARMPKLDTKAITQSVLKEIPQNKASLKIIQEKFETDPMSVIEKILALAKDGKFKLPKDSVDGLDQTISSMWNQVGKRGYLHGGGDVVTAGTGIAITTNSNGQKVISASGGGTGTVTSVSVVSANGISGSVANPTTTPAITLTLGAITPSSVLASGTVGGSNLSGTNTGDQNLFASVIVSGQTTVTTASPTQALTLVAGSNVTITTDNTTKAITIASSGGASGITVGTTTITSGTNTRVLYNNSGVVGEYTVSGSGNVAMTTSPVFTTPNIGSATGSVSGNAGTATILANARTIGGVSFDGSQNITVATATGGFTISGGDLALGANNITMTGSLGATGARLTKGWFTDLQVTNTISGSITGNAATVTTNANLTGVITSSGNATSIASQTGTGTKFVVDTSPTLVTPVLGVATATSVNGLTITSSTGTLTITNLKTLSVLKTLTLDGTDSTTMTFPSTSATIARTDAGQTFTGVNVFTSPKIITQISDTNGNVLVNIGATASAVNYVKITNAATGTAGPILSADGETNVDLKIAGKGTGKIHHTTGIYGDVTAYSPAGAGTATLTFNTSNVHQINMPAGNITIAFSNDAVGEIVTLDIVQDSVGGRTVTWPAGIKWAGGVAPTLTAAANKIDTLMIRVVTAGSAYYGYVAGQNL